MRCFVAVPLPREMKEALAPGFRELKKALGRQRWVEGDSWHITLAFLGELSDDEAALARDALLSLAPPRSFELEADGLLVLPPRGEPRVLALGIGRGRNELGTLWKVFNEGLRELETARGSRRLNGEYHAGGRPFRAHATLARAGREGLGSEWKALNGRMKATGRASSCILYRSELRPEGASHAPLAELAFGEGE